MCALDYTALSSGLLSTAKQNPSISPTPVESSSFSAISSKLRKGSFSIELLSCSTAGAVFVVVG